MHLLFVNVCVKLRIYSRVGAKVTMYTFSCSFSCCMLMPCASKSIFDDGIVLLCLQIQSRTYLCGKGGSGTCNCAIAAREGYDVVVIDFCPNGPKKAWFASQREPAFGTTLHIDASRRIYHVGKFNTN